MTTLEKPHAEITRRRCIALVASTVACPSVALAATPRRPPPYTWEGAALGGDASIVLHGFTKMEGIRLIDMAVAELDRLEQVFSLYRQTSALSQLNRTGLLTDTPDELLDALQQCRTLHAVSAGAFDPTVQHLWEYYAQQKIAADGQSDTAAAFERARAAIGFDRVQVRGKETSLPPGTALTLNGIAQGIITDKVALMFREAGARHTLINLGEFRATGPKENGTAWRVGLRDPKSAWRLSSSVPLTFGALATSAGSGHRMGDGHHILEPITGESAQYYSSVSVTAPTATLADGLSTALYAMPLPQAEELLRNEPDVAARFTFANGLVRKTDGWTDTPI